ncbi:MAG TPA: amidohydrolase family protein, partial [Anaerolineae bacterium]
LDPWRRHLAELAQFPNVFCKVSGLVTEADHERWTPEALRPYLDHVIDTFGFDRLMFGGDWPVASLATDYPRWVETLARAVAGCTVEEQRNLFRENAIRFYRLG